MSSIPIAASDLLCEAARQQVEDDPHTAAGLQFPVGDEPDREMDRGKVIEDLLDTRFGLAQAWGSIAMPKPALTSSQETTRSRSTSRNSRAGPARPCCGAAP
jgi:hypothetical protein